MRRGLLALALLSGMMFAADGPSASEAYSVSSSPSEVAGAGGSEASASPGGSVTTEARAPASTDASASAEAGANAGADAEAGSEAGGNSEPGKSKNRGSAPAPAATSIWIWQQDKLPTSNEEEDAKKKRKKSGPVAPGEFYGLGNEMHLRGWANLGFNAENSDWGTAQQDYRSSLTEIGGDLSGAIYDQAFMVYTLNSSYQRNGTSFASNSSASNGLQYNGTVTFLSLRPYAFSLYFLRSNTDMSGSLLTPFSYKNHNAGIRGQLIYPKLALLSYQFEQGSTGTELRTRTLSFDDRYRTANVAAQRTLAGFELTLSDDYFRNRSRYSDRLRSNNYARLRVGRRFGNVVQMYLRGSRADFAFNSLSNPASVKTRVTALDGGVDWKVSERLRTFASGTLTHNALNTMEVASGATGLPAPPALIQRSSLASQSKTVTGGGNYAVTGNLTIGAVLNYNDAGVPEVTLASLSGVARQGLVTKLFSAGLNLNYNRHIWKLANSVAAGVTRHNYTVATGKAGSGLDWFVSDAVSGGDERNLHYTLRYGFSRTSNPVFFTLFTNQDHAAAVLLETSRFPLARLSGVVQLDWRKQNFAGFDQRLKNTEYRLSATRFNLTAYFAHNTSDADQLLFGIGSVLLQPGASTGAAALPPSLFRPVVFATTRSDAVGVTVSPRANLRVDSRYLRGRYSIVAATVGEQNYWSWDNNVQYKFGRFEMTAGLVKLATHSSGYQLAGHRFYFRVHIPFQVF